MLSDSGLHIPMVVYFPEKWRGLAPPDYRAGGTTDRLVSFVDFALLFSLSALAVVAAVAALHRRIPQIRQLGRLRDLGVTLGAVGLGPRLPRVGRVRLVREHLGDRPLRRGRARRSGPFAQAMAIAARAHRQRRAPGVAGRSGGVAGAGRRGSLEHVAVAGLADAVAPGALTAPARS
jgi:hypothetical protein